MNNNNDFCKCTRCFELKLRQLHYIITFTENKLQYLLNHIRSLSQQLSLFPEAVNLTQNLQSPTFNYLPMQTHTNNLNHQYELPSYN